MNSNDKIIGYYFIGLCVFYLITKILDKVIDKYKERKRTVQTYEPYYNNKIKEPERLTYRKKKILNKTEKEFYEFTKTECEKRNFILLPKVKPEQFAYITYARDAADFIICNMDFELIAGIELEGNGFKNNKEEIIEDIFHKMKLPIFRIKPNKELYQEQIVDILNFLENKI